MAVVKARYEKLVILRLRAGCWRKSYSTVDIGQLLNCSLCSLFVCGLHLAIKLKLLDWTILCWFLHTHYTRSLRSTSFQTLSRVQKNLILQLFMLTWMHRGHCKVLCPKKKCSSSKNLVSVLGCSLILESLACQNLHLLINFNETRSFSFLIKYLAYTQFSSNQHGTGVALRTAQALRFVHITQA